MWKEFNLRSFEKIYEREERKVEVGKIYSVTSKYLGLRGIPYSAYFGVCFPNNDGTVMEKGIRWMNEFGESSKDIQIVFKAERENIQLYYRINTSTPVRSDCQIKVLPLKEVSFEKIDSPTQESFDGIHHNHISRPKSLSENEEDVLERNITWVFASPRSGTTWLTTKLLSYQTVVLNEPKVAVHLGIPEIVGKKRTKALSDKKRKDYFFSEEFKNSWKKNLRKLILNRIFSQIRNTSQKIIIKEPHGDMGYGLLAEVLPNSKMIILLRDGRDIIDSQVAAFSKGGWMSTKSGLELSAENRKDFIEKKSNQWNSVVKELLKVYNDKEKDLKLLLKYEDLRFKTKELLPTIFDFVGIPINSKKIEKMVQKYSFENIPAEKKGQGKAIRSASPGKWEKNFNDKEKKIMNKIMKKSLKKLGYIL